MPGQSREGEHPRLAMAGVLEQGGATGGTETEKPEISARQAEQQRADAGGGKAGTVKQVDNAKAENTRLV